MATLKKQMTSYLEELMLEEWREMCKSNDLSMSEAVEILIDTALRRGWIT